MRDRNFQLFIAELGEATSRLSVPETALARFEGVLPPQLLTYWREEGWCAYADGLFWTVNPEEYDGLVELWLADTPFEQIDTYHVIARSAFGKLYVWSERSHRAFVISCPTHALIAVDAHLRTPAEDPDLAMQVFFATKSRRNIDMKDLKGAWLFERAKAKLGPLAQDQVYGFEPALVAGGKKLLENVHKLDLFAHLAVLRALAAPDIPFAGVGPGRG